MKYKFSLHECYLSVDGKRQTLSRCSACGEYHKTNYGFEVSAEGYRHSFGGRQKFCAKCSKIYIPRISDFFESIMDEISERHASATPSAKTIEIERQFAGLRELVAEECK